MTPFLPPDPTSPETEGEEMRVLIARTGFSAWYGRDEYDQHPVQGMWERVADAILAGPLARLLSDLTAAREERDTLRERVAKLEEALKGILKPFPCVIGPAEDMLEDYTAAVSRFRAAARAVLSSSDPEKQP